MRLWVFLSLYGSLTFAGTFLAVFWSRVALHRKRVIAKRWKLNSDRYFVLAFAIAVSSVGLVLVNGGRLLGNLAFGLSPLLQRAEAWLVAGGLLILLFGYFQMVLLSDLETHPPHWRWFKRMALLTLAWSALSAFLVPLVPMAQP